MPRNKVSIQYRKERLKLLEDNLKGIKKVFEKYPTAQLRLDIINLRNLILVERCTLKKRESEQV